jgi:outer membrane protein
MVLKKKIFAFCICVLFCAPIAQCEQSGAAKSKTDNNASVSLTIEQVINRALIANRTLVQSAENRVSASLSLQAAESDFGWMITPSAALGTGSGETEREVRAGLNLTKKLSSGLNLGFSPSFQKTGGSSTAGLNVSLAQPLLRGRNRQYNLSAVKGARFSVLTANRDFFLTQVNTVVSAVIAAYDVIRKKELLRLNEEYVKRLRGHVEAAQIKEKFGMAASMDVYRARIEMKQAEDSLSNARESYRDTLDNLNILLALPMHTEVSFDAPLQIDPLDITEEKAVETALNRRIEIKHAENMITESERLSRVARHSILPELNLEVGYFSSSSLDNVHDSGFNNGIWGVRLVSSTDLRRNRERISYEQALLSVNSAERNRELKKDEIIREVKTALRNLRVSENSLKIQEEQMKQARGKLELARLKFRYGLAGNFDVIEAEMELRRAETSHLSAAIDQIIGIYRLRATIGTLLEPPEDIS